MRERARRWKRKDFAVPPEVLAPRLIGALVVRVLDDGTRLSGRIVEVEAYLGVRDRGSHSFGGRRTPRVEPMYGPGGTAYVYFTYGMHFCFNVVAGRAGDPVAVLIRALEPVEGKEVMRRSRKEASGKPVTDEAICRGPACICQAMALDRSHSGLDLTTDPRLFIETDTQSRPPVPLVRTPRIGFSTTGRWADAPLRWLVAGHPCVSQPPPGHRREVKPGKPASRTNTQAVIRRARSAHARG